MKIKKRSQIFKDLLYPGDEEVLNKNVLDSLIYYRSDEIVNPYAIIVPASNYKYSLGNYGSSYSQIIGERIDTVVIIAPVCKMAFDGIVLPEYSCYEFFSNIIEIDKEARNFLLKYDKKYIYIDDKAHEVASGVELQLPFLFSIFKNNIKILPVIIGMLNTKLTTVLSKAFFEMQNKLRKRFFYIVATNFNTELTIDKANESNENLINCLKSFDADTLSAKLLMNQIVADGGAGLVSIIRLGELINKKNVNILKISNNVDNYNDIIKFETYFSIIFW